MSTPRKPYRPRAARAPMLVIQQTVPDLSIHELTAVNAFHGGWADKWHWDTLADCRDMLMTLGHRLKSKEAINMAEMGMIALLNIRDREKATGKLGVTGEELKAIRALVEYSQDIWARQSGNTFQQCWRVLLESRRRIKEEKNATRTCEEIVA